MKLTKSSLLIFNDKNNRETQRQNIVNFNGTFMILTQFLGHILRKDYATVEKRRFRDLQILEIKKKNLLRSLT